LFAGCIPIYCGWYKDPEPGILNPNVILWFDPNGNNDSLLKEIQKLNSDEKLLKAFMDQEYFLDTAIDKIYEILHGCYLRVTEITEKVIAMKAEEFNQKGHRWNET
jgi:hypothetical protein